MASYDDWNKIDDEEEDELQDLSVSRHTSRSYDSQSSPRVVQMYESNRDVILFCIDCSESMLKPYDDPKYENVSKLPFVQCFGRSYATSKEEDPCWP